MKNTIILLTVILLAACSKSGDNNVTPTAPVLTTAQTMDSVGITKGKIYLVQYTRNNTPLGTDTLIFNADNTITEICKGVSVTYTPVIFQYKSTPLKSSITGEYTGRFAYSVGFKLTADSATGYFRNQIIKDTAIISNLNYTLNGSKYIQFKWSNPSTSGQFNE